MMTKSSKKRIPFLLTALCLTVCITLSSCGFSSAGSVSVIRKVATRNEISVPGTGNEKLHYSSGTDKLKKTGVSSGFIDLYIDEEKCAPAVYDNSADMMWSALPEAPSVGENEEVPPCSASVVSLRIIGGTDVYLLNSQDNSVAYGTASAEKSDKGYKFTYNIFDSAENASAKKHDKSSVGFAVTLDVTLADGNMTVDCKYKNLTGNKDAFIENIEILNSFGAYDDTDSENFLLVPDGCGAVINTAVYDESFESLSFAVYGDDPGIPDENSGTAPVPAFGIGRGNAAFAALIEKGDAVSRINADKSKGEGSFNRVYSCVNITPCVYEDDKLYISDKPTTDEVKLCYRFLSGINASYSGMASAIREQLIRNSVLTPGSITPTEHLPFYLTLNGIEYRKGLFGIKSPKVLTDFDQAHDMLVRMKNKGISNVTVRYNSAGTGGPDSADITRSEVLPELGGNKGLKELYAYISDQNMSLFMKANILTSAEDFKKSGARDIFNGKVKGEAGFFRDLSGLADVALKVLTVMKNLPVTGICISDAGQYLYSDFSGKGLLRQEASDLLHEKISRLSTTGEIMVEHCNFNVLKNASRIIDIPLTTTVSKSGSYIPVPFIQLILHGICDYAGHPINTGKNTKETLLKYIEYGASPHYEWNYVADDKNESDIRYYDNTINGAAEYYAAADEALNDLRDARMTNHYRAEDGVYCTEYDNGARIIVNYTDSSCNVLGAVVPARSFLRTGGG